MKPSKGTARTLTVEVPLYDGTRELDAEERVRRLWGHLDAKGVKVGDRDEISMVPGISGEDVRIVRSVPVGFDRPGSVPRDDARLEDIVRKLGD